MTYYECNDCCYKGENAENAENGICPQCGSGDLILYKGEEL